MSDLTQSPHTIQPPPLVDDSTVREIYADSFVGIVFNHGNLNMTFAALRADHSKTPAVNFREVACRLVLPITTAGELHAYLSEIIKQLENQGVVKKAPAREGLQ
jgi:hypothetical protein